MGIIHSFIHSLVHSFIQQTHCIIKEGPLCSAGCLQVTTPHGSHRLPEVVQTVNICCVNAL